MQALVRRQRFLLLSALHTATPRDRIQLVARRPTVAVDSSHGEERAACLAPTSRSQREQPFRPADRRRRTVRQGLRLPQSRCSLNLQCLALQRELAERTLARSGCRLLLHVEASAWRKPRLAESMAKSSQFGQRPRRRDEVSTRM